MKVLYITQHGRDSSSGVANKIYSQCKAIQSLGHDCKLLCPDPDGVCFFDFSESSENYFQRGEKHETFWQKIKRWGKIFSPAASEHIKKFSPDIIYIRGIAPLLPRCVSFLRKHKGHSKIFWEFPTYPYRQEFFKPLRLTGLIYLLFDIHSIERLKKVVDEFVVVSEIDDAAARERLGKYRIIHNGFDVSSVPVRTALKLEGEINILALANVAYWHGYDRIIAGMAEYSGAYKVKLHLAGGTGKTEMEKLKKQASELGVSDQVIFYEPLYGDALSELFDKCHVAAGSLGIHRNSLFRASILKLREYCSRGIPFFKSHLDDDFKNFEFGLNFEASDVPIDIAKLCGFVEEIYKTDDYPQIMRKYAEQYLDWKSKVSKLFE